MATFTQLPGDPSTLAWHANTHIQFAELILKTARQLDEVVDDTRTIGKSVDEIRSQATVVAGAILQAQPRYKETALALRDYSVKLQDAQDKASSAISAGSTAENHLGPLRNMKRDLDDDLRKTIYTPISPDDMDDLLRNRNNVEWQIDQYETDAAGATSAYNQAVAERDAAAQAAIHRIQPALDELNDSFMDRVAAALGDLGDFFAAIGEWIAKFLTDILFAIIVIVVALVVVIIVLSFVLSIVGLVLGILLLTGVIQLSDLQGLLDVFVTVLLFLIPILVPAIYLLLAREWLTPTPEMKETTPVIGDEHGRAIVKDDEGNTRTVGDYEDAFTTNGVVDSDGGTAKTEVSIIQVMNADGTPKLDANGNPIWRVTLPSTQNWQITDGGDTGAMNDLGSNLALMLSPQQQAAYERAVIEAMHKAGIGPNDPVMLVGFSQGGILAGKMASTDPQPFNIDAIVVGGAPIDAMHIPNDVQVLSFQHPDDPVHQLDGASHHDTSNWVTIHDSKDQGEAAHGSTSYSLTAKHIDDGPNDPATQAIVDKQSEFFSDYEIEHKYAGAE
ncbi:MAG: hypothetical protein JWO10_841 [Microbacteriaceae bacterium]|nr:hypothetical protein [Microbacteriaceae bacterium]